MTFENPHWLYLTPVIVLIMAALLALGLRRRDTLLMRFVAPRLLDQLTGKASRKRSLLKALLLLLAVATTGMALARPQYGVDWIKRKARGLDIVFVLDSSKSMLATDLRPTRLDRAKLAVLDLIERLESDRIGLVVFAGRAFLQTPPTLDYAAFRESLDSIDPNVMTRGGSDLGNALREAAKAFPEENNVKVVVLLTDGEDLGGNAVEAARHVADQGIKVYAIGIGTPEGEYLKVRDERGDESFVRDSRGQPVRSQLDEATLEQVARVTGGSYSRLNGGALDTLYSAVLASLPRKERESELQETHIERYQWALSAALVFLVSESLIRRRRSTSIQAAILLALALQALTPSPAQAEKPQTPGLEAPAPAGEHEGTHSEEKDPRRLYNEARKLLGKGDYDAARLSFEQALQNSNRLHLQRDSLYNMAHAVNQTAEAALKSQDFQTAIEKWKEAEGLFKAAHEIDPDDRDAQEDEGRVAARRKALEDFIKQQKQQQQDKQQQDKQQQDKQQQDKQQQEQKQQDQQSGSGQQDPQDSKDQQSDRNESQSNEQQSGGQGQQSSSEHQQNQNSGDESSSGQENSAPDQNASQQEQSGNQQSAGEPGEDRENEKEEAQSQSADSAESSQEVSRQDPRSGQESTANPVDDLPQPAPGKETDKDQGKGNESATASAGTGNKEASAQAGAETVQVKGMNEAEARALLDSMRDAERLLPFVEQNDSARNQTGNLRDW